MKTFIRTTAYTLSIVMLTLATLGSGTIFATPLTDAVENDDLAMVQKLIADKVDVNASDSDGYTALHLAATSTWDQRQAILKALLKYGADVKAKTNNGYTPLHMAFDFQPDIVIVKALIEAKSDVNAKNNSGQTPLFFAAARSSDSLESLKTLLAQGAYVNIKDGDGNTPLHKASGYNSHPDIVKALIKAKADVNAKNNRGQTPLLQALISAFPHNPEFPHKGTLEVIQEFIKAGADVNIPDNYGVTPLYLAAMRSSEDVVKALIEAGANVNAVVGDEGETPLDIARAEEVKEVLIAAGAKRGSELKK